MLPRITLITPSFQQAAYLEECLASVHGQGYADLEHIVVDGGSTDGSRELIEKRAGDLTWWCSERDRGQSHAINKGLDRATGHVFGWLNSDDLLLPGALQKVGEAFAADPGLMVLSGIRRLRHADGREEAMPTDDASDPDRFYTAPRINQQSTFFRMDAVRAVGSLDERLQCLMDYELWLQLLFRFGVAGVRVVPWELAVFRQHGTSKTARLQKLFLAEQASILHGICRATGEHELARVLVIGHEIVPDLRGIPVHADMAGRVRPMVVAFLLKWHHTIFSSVELEMMRAFRKVLPADLMLDPTQREQLHRVDDQLRAGSWWAFRARRKWKHLFG